MMESPIYSSLNELFDMANLTEVEKEAFLRNKKYCEYWLLRSKRGYHQSFTPSLPNFIKRIARVINHLESDSVSGDKKQKIKEMFSVGSTVHRVFKTKTGCRSKQNSPILENTYFELLILSFLVEQSFEIELVKSRGTGRRIPEFVATNGALKLSVEAKQIEIDSLLDNIFGDSFTDDNFSSRSIAEQAKGYEKAKFQIEKRYESAISKYKHINEDENYIVFMSIYNNFSLIGSPAINYLNSLQTSWIGQNLVKFVGLVIPDEKQTFFIKNKECNQVVLREVNRLNFERFHEYVPCEIG